MKHFTQQFISYFVVAFIAVLGNIIARFVLNFYLSFSLSVVLGYIFGHFINFYLSQKFIFTSQDSKSRISRNFIKFSLVASVGLCIAFGVSMLSFKILNTYFSSLSIRLIEFISHICGIGFSFVCNFLGHKFFSFKHTGISLAILHFLKRSNNE